MAADSVPREIAELKVKYKHDKSIIRFLRFDFGSVQWITKQISYIGEDLENTPVAAFVYERDSLVLDL